MEPTSKQLLDCPMKPSIIETLLLSCTEPSSKPQQNNKHQTDGDVKGPITTPIPTSLILGKVKDFLGVMGKANERLEHDTKENSKTNFDIEVLNGTEEEYIEMDLLLGVADLHSDEAVAAAETSMGRFRQPLTSETEDESDEDDNDDSDDGHPGKGKKPKSDSSPHGRPNKRPKIVVLD